MNLFIEPATNSQGKILDAVSDYMPDERTQERLALLRQDYLTADQIRNKPYREFNYRNLWQVVDDCFDRFINFVGDLTDSDPSQQWRANTVRPLTRNKVLEIAAYVTTMLMYPKVVAQDEDAQAHEDVANVMEDCMEWTNEQSNYALNFMYSVIAALITPCAYIYEGYAEYTRKFKVPNEDGTYDEKEFIDDVFSGYQSEVIPCDEIYIGDPYEPDIQKQPFLIHRRIIRYEAAKVKYGKYEAFEKVKAGIRTYFVNFNSIYEQQTEQLADRFVEEVTYYNRIADLEIGLINGICLTDPDRPMQRKDKRYPFAKTGYGLYDDGRFFYYKPLVDDLKPDQDAADILINLILDGAFLRTMPPSVLYGDETIDTGIMIPGAVFPLQRESELKPVQMSQDVGLSMNVMQMIESNADASSKKDLQRSGNPTAYGLALQDEDIKTKLGLFGKMLAQLVRQFGNLRIATILDKMTVAQMAKIATEPYEAIAYAKILVQGQDESGAPQSKTISFNPELPVEEISEDELLERSYALLAKEGDINTSSKRLIEVNPKLFREMKYTIKIDPQSLFRKSELTRRAETESLYQLGIQNQFADQKGLYQMLVNSFKPGEAQKLTKKEEETAPGASAGISQLFGGGAMPKKINESSAEQEEGIMPTPAAPRVPMIAQKNGMATL